MRELLPETLMAMMPKGRMRLLSTVHNPGRYQGRGRYSEAQTCSLTLRVAVHADVAVAAPPAAG